MNQSPKILSREELYEQIWSDPMIKVAPKYNISDVGLSKICKKHHIPKPPVGHWTKLAHGKTSRKIPLPTLDDSDLKEIRLFRNNFYRKTVHPKSPAPVIKVPDRLSRPHHLTKVTKKDLSKSRADDRGVLLPEDLECLDIRASKNSISRALRIFDTLIKHWESTDGRVMTDEKGTHFSKGKDTVNVKLSERIKREELPNEKWYCKQYKYEATGMLKIKIDSWLTGGMRTKWADGKVQRVEDMLGKIVVSLDELIKIRKTHRIDRECNKRQEELAKKARHVNEEKEAALTTIKEHLINSSDAWTKAQQIRSFLSALKTNIEKGVYTADDPEKHQR